MRKRRTFKTKKINIKKIYFWSTLITVILLIPTSIARTGRVFPDFTKILGDVGDLYFSTREYRTSASKLIEYIRIIFSPILAMYIPLTIYMWKKLSVKYRVIAIISIPYIMLISAGQGQNKGIFDVFIILIAIIPIIAFKNNIKIKISKKIRNLILIFCMLFIIFSFFSNNISSRTNGSLYNARTQVYADMNSGIMKIIPENLKYGFAQMSSYLTQGYYGMALALELDFEPMYGVGSSRFITENFVQLFNKPEIRDMTYPARTKIYGWDPDIVWSSAYPWIASDISFYGIPILLIIFGALISMTWKESIYNNNFISCIYYTQLIIIALYLPANNQMFQNPESFFGFFVLTIIWYKNRKSIIEEI
ncbi:hypothetical protein H8J87_12570 [Clostridium perfringens]|uniref:hypothetical protein n=1 Tax=Clostridium perfringens TaxID=1502 RepID=UPI0018E44F73|nr:hypothetical protein [Clostridium perfringens]ELC8453848.1 hypothetical protein [Clostridium perfringens]ELC8454936.1 hypothetical protein [Clostridium perfringens]MBI6074871.1 hypothetical protein [Clostridium perfringens]QUD73577.1 hypothetical protein KB552_02500 [Clostridium perfringens]